jgi:hypothetical protein
MCGWRVVAPPPRLGIRPVVVFKGHGELVEMASVYGCHPAVVWVADGDAMVTALTGVFGWIGTHRVGAARRTERLLAASRGVGIAD